MSSFYGNIQALRGVSLHVEAGEIVVLLGANGAGKTTLLNTISGLIPSRRGSIFFLDRDIINLTPEKIVRLGISQVPEGRQLFGELTVYDNLMLGAYVHRHKGKKEIERKLEFVYNIFPVLKERSKQYAETLSGGQQQMLSIGRALMSEPKLLLLDEPSLGLAPKVVAEIFAVIKELKEKNGTTILLVEQNARMALSIADRGYVLDTGRIILEGSSAELLENREVIRAYLGRGYREIWE